MTEEDFRKEMEAARQYYEQTEIPEGLGEMVARTLEEHGGSIETDRKNRKEETAEKRKVIQMKEKKRRSTGKTAAVAAACAVFCFTAALNISPAFAEEMSKVPGLSTVSNVLTFRSYEFSDGDKTVGANIPQIQAEGAYTERVNDEIQRIVADYQTRANEDIAAYKEAFLATGGTEEEFAKKNIQVKVDYEVKCETEEILSLVLTGWEDWNASTAVTEYYNISLADDREITLEDLLGEDYINIANEQIREQIAQDESGMYFVEDEGGFTSITEDTDFYINQAGNPVIVFQKYEIAPGAAGMPEFEIQSAAE
ncbi:DUF3298 domain-containing protein [Anaerotignum lactatifermentans]|uniref:DUF3298 domain-containing protein n=1 Tax=Anaerotignum lactatifermentans TaxID=160404 RepID=A0ABS2G8K2_9FIRM|nr:RsiV family protein [Anaerotignum lactatifermentans]MBM6828718.1 DUF3298 domain-containing protein [Anaerotignum lactatifermentans]MBM6877045.1 DUF3298 domain-containing protein [Anaerotignum lactatifermentans]MBM6950300.1 DUF3298 domain-containing protein [Anaerotignum lactatifermentans]